MYFQLTGNDIYFGIQKALMGDEEDAYLGLGKFDIYCHPSIHPSIYKS